MIAGPPEDEKQQPDFATSGARQDDRPRVHLNDSPRFNLTYKIIGLVGAVLGAIVAVIVLVNLAVNGRAGSSQAAQSESSSSKSLAESTNPGLGNSTPEVQSSAPSSLAISSPSKVAVPAGTCLGPEGVEVPCNGPHKYEVVDATRGDCRSAALTYAGADPDLDVTSLKAISGPIEGSSFGCALTLPDGIFVHSMDGNLSNPTGDEYRKCELHTTVDREVPCSELHTREYFTLAPGKAPDQSNCDEAADRYLGVTRQRFADLVKIVPLAYSDLNDGQPRCAVEVRGNDVLTASVRANGTKALPLQAAS